MQTIDYWSGTDAGNGGASGTSFVDKNTGIGYEGTYVKSGWLNMIQSELVNAITDSGQSLSNSDSEQLKKAINKYIVTTDKTITVDYTNGSDTTGNFDNSFATLQGAINWLSRVTIQRSATVTISVNANAGKRAETSINFSHPQGDRIKINALNESAGVSISSISYSTPTITVNTSAVHGLSIGDYVTITGVSPANWNLFGIVASTPTTSQFTITWTAGLTIPAYSSGGTVVKQSNVFTFNNTNGFLVNGKLGELNIAVSQTGTLSGEDKFGILVCGLKEVVSSTNYFKDGGVVCKGKLYAFAFKNGVGVFNHSSVLDSTVISCLNTLSGVYSANNSVLKDSITITNSNVIGLYSINNSVTSLCTNTSCNNSAGIDIEFSSTYSGNTFYVNNNGTGIIADSNSIVKGNTIQSISNNTTVAQASIGAKFQGNGLTGGLGTYSPGFQTNANFATGSSNFCGAMIIS